jgi:hypothetical protein
MRYTMAMHSPQGSAKHKHVSPPAIITALVVSVLAAAFVTTCNFPLTFGDEYRDSSTNFIADRVLAEPPPATDDGSGVALDALAVWDWGWRAQAGNTYQYMEATDLGPATGPGGSGNAWLLEAVNLAVNPAFDGGDTTGWAADGAAISGAGSIHGNALNVNPGSTSGFAYIDTGTFFSELDMVLAHSYTISLNAAGNIGLSGLRYLETDPAFYSTDNLQPSGWSGAGPFKIGLANITTTSTNTLTFTYIDSNFQFDDISAIRTDVFPRKWSLVLRLGRTDTEPALVPGIYEFAVHVKRPTLLDGAPADYLFSTYPFRDDSEYYAARYVTLRATQTAGGIIQTVAEQSFDISALPDTWNRLVLRMPKGSNFTFPESTTGGAIELSISPMNPSSPEAGAVLIADPSLHFYIDGY